MSKYYMFEIESIVQTFTVLDTGKEISFGYSSAEEQECFKDVNGGDLILGYYNEPIDTLLGKQLYLVYRQQLKLIQL